MAEQLPLHPTRGVDPHQVRCMRCGKTTGMTVGHLKKMVRRRDGVLLGYTAVHKVRAALIDMKLGEREVIVTDVPEGEVIPEVCGSCRQDEAREREEMRRHVVSGGVWMLCAVCGRYGVAMPNTQQAEAVRKANKVAAPKECGIRYEECVGWCKKAPEDVKLVARSD